VRHYSVLQALTNPRVLAIALVYFGAVAMNYGLSFFLPQIVKAFVTLTSYAIGAAGMIYWGLRSDKEGERKLHLVIALFLAAAGIAASAFVDNPYIKMLLISVGSFGVFAALPLIWTLPTAFLSGAAAGGIAAINALGNLSGFLGPYVVGYIKDRTGSFTGGLLAIAAAGAVGMIIVMLLRHDTRLEYVAQGVIERGAKTGLLLQHVAAAIELRVRALHLIIR
jgi:ACS family tartrate transporter-like MFS transporter